MEAVRASRRESKGRGQWTHNQFYGREIYGTVLQVGVKEFLPSGHPAEEFNELYIPFEAADKMGFGLVPGEAGLGVPDYKLGTEEEVLATLRNVVDPSREAAETVKGLLEANPGWTPGVSDIIGFAAPMIRQPHSSIVRVPQPAGYAVGLTQQQEGFVVFHKRLVDRVEERDAKGEPVSQQTRWILRQYADLIYRYGEQWENQEACNQSLNDRSMEFLDDLHGKTSGCYETPQRLDGPLYWHRREIAGLSLYGSYVCPYTTCG